ncbi:MAG: hypothetical protein WC560_12880 [Syntrophales bacterium]
MFRHIHHQSWFPFVVIGLSLTLVLFIVWSYAARQNNPAAVYNSAPAVTLNSYQNEVGFIMKDFWSKYDTQTNDATRLAFVSETEQKLLALLVPAEGQSIHFELVSGLEFLRQGLVGNAEKMSEGKARLQKVFLDNSWLTQ